MAALTGPYYATPKQGTIKTIDLPLAAGQTAWEGASCSIDSANLGAVYRSATGETTLQPIGTFLRSVDNSAGGSTVPVPVELNREVNLTYWDSVTGGGAVTTANLFGLVYVATDHEVTTVSTTASVVGRVWKILPNGRVGVEFPF